MKLLIPFISLVLLSCGCKEIKYEDDNITTQAGYPVYPSSGVAGSPEFYTTINGQVCSHSGSVGGCYVTQMKDKDTVIAVLDQKYAFHLSVICSSWLGWNGVERDYPANVKPEKIVISASHFIGVDAFLCVTRIYPEDRPKPISAFSEVRVRLIDANYTFREEQFMYDKYQVFGKYSKFSKVMVNGRWANMPDRTTVMDASGKEYPAMSESNQMRYNYSNKVAPNAK